MGGSRKQQQRAVDISMALLEGKAYDPAILATHELSLSMSTLGEIGEPGPTHHLVGHPKGSEAIGAFEWTPLTELTIKPSQQSMWAASKVQTTIATTPTHGGEIVDQNQANAMVRKRSRWFLSRNMRWTSQAVVVVKTPRAAHGGRAWNALQGISDEVGQCIALYYNSVFGAAVRNSYGQSAQAGRATIQVGAIAGLPCPAFHADTEEARRARELGQQHFSRLSKLKLEPFSYCFRDKNRHEIDSVVAEMLGLDPNDESVQEMLDHYRGLFASEPSVNGRQPSIIRAIEDYIKVAETGKAEE